MPQTTLNIWVKTLTYFLPDRFTETEGVAVFDDIDFVVHYRGIGFLSPWRRIRREKGTTTSDGHE